MIDKQILHTVVKCLGEDVAKPEPQFTNTIFSGNDLCRVAGIELIPAATTELMNFLVAVHYC